MAKYRFSTQKNRSINCNILDENLLANTYTVKFDSGLIKEVPTSRVYDLDHIDEAVLDRLKDFATSLWDRIVKSGKYVFMKVKNMFIPANSPVNTMIAAQEIDGVSFLPGKQLAEISTKMGVEPVDVRDDIDEDEKYYDEMADYLRDKIEEYKEENNIDESFKTSKRNTRKPKLYEGKLYEAEGDMFELSSKSWPNYGSEKLIDMLLDQYDAFLNGAASRGADSIPIPYCIWGAPGVGKTQIIDEAIDIIREVEGDANIITINAMAMRKDDFTFPVKVIKSLDVVNKNGENVKLSVQDSSDVMKSWLPVYDPTNEEALNKGISIEQLDDVANGGDGTGNGKGGIIFIDELSRISGDVLNVIMTLVQNRRFNNYRIGSKWMIVAAANPPQVLGASGERMMWDPAQTDRFQHVFFQATFQEWIKWARKPIKGTKRQHIPEELLVFLENNRDCWHNLALVNDEEKKDKVAKTRYPNPRAYANAAKSYYEKLDARERENNDPNSFRARANALRGRTNRPMRITPSEMQDILASNVGKKVAGKYGDFYRFDGVFSTELAKQVWVDGVNTEIPFQTDNVILDRAIGKIFDSHHDVSDNDNTITPEEFANLCSYVVRAIDEMDEYSGASKDVIVNAAAKTIAIRMNTRPFKIDLATPENRQAYKEGLKILNDRTLVTRKNIRDLRSEQ